MFDKHKDLLTVGKKKGEWDFSIRATIQDLSFEEMQEFRAMLITAIGASESMWKRRPEASIGQRAPKKV